MHTITMILTWLRSGPFIIFHVTWKIINNRRFKTFNKPVISWSNLPHKLYEGHCGNQFMVSNTAPFSCKIYSLRLYHSPVNLGLYHSPVSLRLHYSPVTSSLKLYHSPVTLRLYHSPITSEQMHLMHETFLKTFEKTWVKCTSYHIFVEEEKDHVG